MTHEERFWKGIERKGAAECWPFIGANMVQWDGRPQQKRRVAWIVTKGRIPKGQMVLLTCGNGPCCNPAHLFLGKSKERGANMVRHGRGTIGETNMHAKLDAEKVREIRRRRAEGEKPRHLAKEFDVTPHYIWQMCARETWKHVV